MLMHALKFLSARPLLATVLLASVLFGGAALAAAYAGTFAAGGPWATPFYAKAGGFVGSGSTSDTANRINAMKRCSRIIDFPPLGGTMTALDTYCAESFAVTCTGVVFGDQLSFGVDQVLPGGGIITPYVSAADAVKLRACASGITDAGAFDMPDASYTILWTH